MAEVSIACKKTMVKEIAESLKEAGLLIVTNYKSLTSQDINELRRELKSISDDYLVVKNSMIKKALADSPNNKLLEFVNGEVGIVIDKKTDPSYSTKLVVKFAKNHEFFEICGGVMKGEAVSKSDIAMLAALPSREVLLSKLANVLNSPISGLAQALNGIIVKFLYALNAVKEKKSASGAKNAIVQESPERTPEQTTEQKP